MFLLTHFTVKVDEGTPLDCPLCRVVMVGGDRTGDNRRPYWLHPFVVQLREAWERLQALGEGEDGPVARVIVFGGEDLAQKLLLHAE